jgi:hypothetical protein
MCAASARNILQAITSLLFDVGACSIYQSTFINIATKDIYVNKNATSMASCIIKKKQEPSISGINHLSAVVLFSSNTRHEILYCLEPFALPWLPFFFPSNFGPHILHPCFFSSFSMPSHLLTASH